MLLVGIGGGTGSGKTTLVRQIVQQLPPRQAVVIPQDAYYKDNSHIPFEKRRDINFDHPDSVDFNLLISQMEQLKAGRFVEQPEYSFLTCTRSAGTIRVEPARVMILEGILVLANKKLRKLIDVKVFVDAMPDDRLARIIRRDMEERGRTEAQVLERYERTVKPMHQQFIEPSRRYADIIVQADHDKRYDTAMLTRIIKEKMKQIQGSAHKDKIR
jgi:uridine kinase